MAAQLMQIRNETKFSPEELNSEKSHYTININQNFEFEMQNFLLISFNYIGKFIEKVS